MASEHALHQNQGMTAIQPIPYDLDVTFAGPVISEKNSGWACVVMSGSGDFFGTRRTVKVSGEADGIPFEATMMPMGDGTHMVPLKLDLRKALGKGVGDEVTVHLTRRRS